VGCNDAVSIYFADATLASAFVARWCVGSKVETAGGVFMSRRRGSGRGCIGRPEGPGSQDGGEPVAGVIYLVQRGLTPASV